MWSTGRAHQHGATARIVSAFTLIPAPNGTDRNKCLLKIVKALVTVAKRTLVDSTQHLLTNR
jgi:hypothetical protein